MAQSTKPRSQGGGRKANSEPRQQVFKEFNGCNFQLSPRDFTLGKEVDQEQADLQMNYVVIQHNAGVTDNKTIETRNNIVKLFEPPNDQLSFTNASILVRDFLYIGMSDGSLYRYKITGEESPYEVELTDNAMHGAVGHTWSSFEYIDGKLIGMTVEGWIWIGNEDPLSKMRIDSMENSARIDDPDPPYIDPDETIPIDPTPGLPRNNVRGMGVLSLSATETDNTPFRVGIAWSYVNKFGPTRCSDQSTFYASAPVDEWHSGQYTRVTGMLDPDDNIEAVEIYYTVGNASVLQFAGRVDIDNDDVDELGRVVWSYDWMGYLDSTSMWPMANLIAPTENMTDGVHATHIKAIDGRLYFWGGDNPYRLWIGGNPGNLLSTSPGTGGGFVDVEPDTGQEIRVVTKYKTQSGASIVTILTDSPNSSKEQRFNLVENSITISNEQNMKSWQAEQVAGSVGCKSFKGGLACEDGLYSISRYGLALTTMTMEYNSQIRTNYVSAPVKPVFTDLNGIQMKNSILLERDGIMYLAFGEDEDSLDELLFCYDIDLKAWWTVSIDVDGPIIDLLHIDYESAREGIGIVTYDAVYMLPLTHDDDPVDEADFPVVLQTGELATTQPQQNWVYLSQLEFRFDYFLGYVDVDVTGIDQFGRRVETHKRFSHDETQYDLAEYMRVDLRLQSYQIRITGQARFRLTHFIAKVYVMSAKQGLVWGFDDSQSFRSDGDIHPTFRDYNDIRQAIIV